MYCIITVWVYTCVCTCTATGGGEESASGSQRRGQNKSVTHISSSINYVHAQIYGRAWQGVTAICIHEIHHQTNINIRAKSLPART